MNDENAIKPHGSIWNYIFISVGVAILFSVAIVFINAILVGKNSVLNSLEMLASISFSIPVVTGLLLIIGPLRILKGKSHGKLITNIGLALLIILAIIFFALISFIGSIHEM